MLIFLFLTSILCGAETTYHCNQFQKDIDYWQRVYKEEVEVSTELYRELMLTKAYILEEGIKIPNFKGDVSIQKAKKKKGFTRRKRKWWD